MVANQPQSNENLLPFNYADPASAGEYLPCLKLDEGKQVLVAFLENIPGMQSPPFVYCRVHWNSEMGEKGRKFQCFGGQCCEQITWQKGFGGSPGEFKPNKASKRYFIPVVHYEQDPKDPTAVRATVKYIDMTWTAFSSLSSVIEQTNEGLSFFSRDVLIDVQKSNGPTNYVFNKRESEAKWLTDPVLKAQVEEQLPEVGQRLLNSLPPVISESEFMEMKPTLDAKVQASMKSHEEAQASQQGFNPMPQQNFAQAPQQAFGPMPQQAFNSMPQQNFVQAPQQAFNPMPQQNFVQAPQQAFNPMPQQMQTVGVDTTQPQVTTQFTQPQVNIPVDNTIQSQSSSNIDPYQTPLNNEQKTENQSSNTVTNTEVPSVDLAFNPNVLLK